MNLGSVSQELLSQNVDESSGFVSFSVICRQIFGPNILFETVGSVINLLSGLIVARKLWPVNLVNHWLGSACRRKQSWFISVHCLVAVFSYTLKRVRLQAEFMHTREIIIGRLACPMCARLVWIVHGDRPFCDRIYLWGHSLTSGRVAASRS